MIVDTSALVAILRAESGAETLAQALQKSDQPIRLSAASYVELGIVIDAAKDPVASRRVDELLRLIGITIEPVTAEHALLARAAYRDFGKGSGHPARLNFGDCFAYALAKDRNEPLLFKGNDFSHTDVGIQN